MKLQPLLDWIEYFSTAAFAFVTLGALLLSKWIVSKRFADHHDRRSANRWIRIYESLTNRPEHKG